jgi:hypothetical protein
MLRTVSFAFLCGIGCALVSIVGVTANAGTIIKLNLGGDSAADIVFDGTQLSIVDDGNGATTGNQDTNVEFLDFLSGETDIVGAPPASFSMSGLATDGAANVFNNVLVIQNFTGGTFNLYDDANALLLSGMLDDSTLTGPIGPPATGALFTTTFASVTGGSLASQIDSDTITLSMSLSAISGGTGFGVTMGAGPPVLNSFTADATLSMAAEQIPEPVAATLMIVGALWLAGQTHRRRG